MGRSGREALFEQQYDPSWGYDRAFFLDNEHRYTEMHRLLREELGDLDGIRALDLGCCRGQLLARFRRYRGVEVEAIELDDSEAAMAREAGLAPRHHQINVFEAARMTAQLPYSDSRFNVVLAGEILEHIVDTESFVAEILRVLVPGGALVLTTPNLLSLKSRLGALVGRPPATVESRMLYGEDIGHVRLFTLATLRALLDDVGFASVRIVGKRIVPIAVLDRLPPRVAQPVDRLAKRLPALSDGLIAVARKPR